MRAAQNDLWLRDNPPEIDFLLHWPPFNVSKDHPITKTTGKAHEQVTGEQAKVQGFVAAADASFLNGRGIPSIVYGPGNILVAHAVNEYVSVEELITAAKTYALSAINWCGVEE